LLHEAGRVVGYELVLAFNKKEIRIRKNMYLGVVDLVGMTFLARLVQRSMREKSTCLALNWK
jgi:hypothetical protein